VVQLNRAVQLARQTGIMENMAELNNLLAISLIGVKDYRTAEKYLSEALQLATKSANLEFLKMTYSNLSFLDSTTGNFKKALQNHKLAVTYADSISNAELRKKLTEKEMQFVFAKKEDSLLQKQLVVQDNLGIQKKQKSLFVTVAGLLAMMLFFVFRNFRIQKRINQLQQKNHENEKKEIELKNQHEVLSERFRISRDLHDEIGATLSGIAMYSHLIKENLGKNQADAAKYSVDIIQNSATEMVTKLNDIIWLINPQKETLEDIFVKLREYAQNMCIAKNISPHIEVSGEVESCKLSIETRKNIYLFCKEAINNVAKYSNATMLKMSFLLHESLLEIIISDDGNGFDMNTVKKGNGLDNMQKRADDMGAHCQIQSSPQQGCIISLSLKITQRGIV
jgi:signal transduction histidine kinase